MRLAPGIAPAPASAALEVRAFVPADAPAWDGLVAAAPEATFFHALAWRDVVEASLGHRGHYRCAWRGDRLVGLLPLVHVRSRLFCSALISTAFGVYGGILATDADAARAVAADAQALGAALGV